MAKGCGVKRRDILKKLLHAGFILQEGASHTKAYDENGVFRAVIGRHGEIPERTVKMIEKQTGVKLHQAEG